MLQCLADRFDHRRHRVSLTLRDLEDVVAEVAAFGRLLPVPPGLDRGAKEIDLCAVIVDVVLALDLVAAEGEQARQRVAVGGVTPRPDG